MIGNILLEFKFFQSGLSLLATIFPEKNYHHLPPRLRKKNLNSISNCNKASRVFPSRYVESASSRTCLFHRVRLRDSVWIVTPFVQDTNYVPMNFATLGSSELRVILCNFHCTTNYGIINFCITSTLSLIDL